jgi:hypothetical protein
VPTAERYLRTGGRTDTIYPATLAMLTRAIKEARTDSARYPGEHFLEAVYRSGRFVFQVWEDGECTWKFEDS